MQGKESDLKTTEQLKEEHYSKRGTPKREQLDIEFEEVRLKYEWEE
ncbi:MAG: hypothetical protein IPL46_03570 [Saprospiraceae bacterium]|nr:hypothetical protein [Saprospiraceae bacterium]